MENSFSNRTIIENFQNSIKIINKELQVRKPHPSIKTLFNGKQPKNRLNLKKFNKIKVPKRKNEVKIIPKNSPSIKALIRSSLDNEFINPVKPNNIGNNKILSLKNYSSSSTLYSINANQLKNFNSNKNITNNLLNKTYINTNNNLFNSTGSLPMLGAKSTTKLLNKTNNIINTKQEKDLNQLYQEYIQHVSLFIIIYLLLIIEHNTKINFE
jgi:hypothetical protein